MRNSTARLVLPLLLAGASCDGGAEPDKQSTGTTEVEADVDLDGDGVLSVDDCDDEDPDTYPGAEESCDGVDNNCDGDIDEGLQIEVWVDADGDGFGAGEATLACSAGDGEAETGGDCDDGLARVHPGADEFCDSQDNDCDGLVDDDDDSIDPDSQRVWYPDSDGDGYGDGAADAIRACRKPADHTEDSGDCDDSDPALSPAAGELCNGVDDDCDGDIDGAVAGGILFADFDDGTSHRAFQLNGDATYDPYQEGYDSTGNIALTSGIRDEGSAFLEVPLEGARWEASFSYRVATSGPGYSEGATFAWLSPTEPATSLDGRGAGLGFHGLDGFAVELDLVADDDGGNYHIAIKGGDGTTYASTGGGSFRTSGGTTVRFNDVTVRFDEGDVEVWVGGESVLTATIPDYDLTEARFGFTGSTYNDLVFQHISHLDIACLPDE